MLGTNSAVTISSKKVEVAVKTEEAEKTDSGDDNKTSDENVSSDQNTAKDENTSSNANENFIATGDSKSGKVDSTTTSKTSLPQAGIKTGIIIVIVTLVAGAIYSYRLSKKYKNI